MSLGIPPSLASALALVASVFLVVWAARKRGLTRRAIPLTLFVSSLLPALVVLVVWARWSEVPFVRFARPWLTFPTAAVGAWMALRLLQLSARVGLRRRLLMELWTAVAALSAILAVSGIELGAPVDRLTVVVAIDRSRSIDLVPGVATRVPLELRVAESGMREQDRIATVVFGATAMVQEPARPRNGVAGTQVADVGRDGTDIAAGLRQALAEIPPDSAGRVVIISDGVATRGDVTQVALAASALGVPVDVVPLDPGELPSVRVISVRVAPRAALGEALELKVVTQASADADVELRVYRDGELIRKGPARLSKGEDVVYLREVAPDAGLHRYDVEISAREPRQDHFAQDNAGAAFVRVKGPSTALVLEKSKELGAAMARALRSAAFEVSSADVSGAPADVAGFARYDLVVLGGISAAELSGSQLQALKSYVRDLGGGLLLMGGDRSMGPGGYNHTPVEEVSPVSFDLKQERRRASLAEVIAVDYSGSMSISVGGQTKLELANEAAVRSSELLGAGDQLGVLHVDTRATWTVPLASVSNKADIAARIRKVGPGGGGIYVDLTLATAYAALGRQNVQLKHLLLFSDGSDAEERQNAFALVRQAKERGITTSVVALGNGSDVPALSRMAELGGGRFYLLEDATRLPAVFAQETILATRSAIHETPFVPRAPSPSAVLRGVDLSGAPPLTGYVVTLPKARAQVQLVGPEGDPILASWSAGIGRCAAFTSDYTDRWGAAWTSWEGAARLFAQLGRELSRRVDDPQVRFEADASGGELSLRASVLDERGRHEVFRRLHVRVAGPDGFTRELALEAVGAGSYAAKLPLSRPGAYLATLLDEQRSEPLATTGAVLSEGEELRPSGGDRVLLARIAELTSGKVRDTLAGVFHDREARRFAYSPLGEWLSMLSALALLGAVASRRLSLPSSWLARLSRARPARPPVVPDPVARDPGEGTLGALRAAKLRTAAAAGRAPGSLSPEVLPTTAKRESNATPAASTPSNGATAERPPVKARTAAEILLERRRRNRL